MVALSTRLDRFPVTGVYAVRLAPSQTGGEIQGVWFCVVGDGKLSVRDSSTRTQVPSRKAKLLPQLGKNVSRYCKVVVLRK